jgi:hypothetical protein
VNDSTISFWLMSRKIVLCIELDGDIFDILMFALELCVLMFDWCRSLIRLPLKKPHRTAEL